MGEAWLRHGIRLLSLLKKAPAKREARARRLFKKDSAKTLSTV
jgi:hypothetical protein